MNFSDFIEIDERHYDDSAISEMILKHYEKIAESELFSSSKTLPSFLEYIINETLNHRSDHIKSLSIADSVFSRDPLNAASDGVVRSAAVRLRSALEKYYSTLGENDDIVISLPKGRYVPRIYIRKPKLADVQASRGNRFRWGTVGLVALAGAVSCVMLVMAYAGGVFRPARQGMDDVIILVAPTKALDGNLVPIARHFDSRLAPAFSEIGIVDVIRQDSGAVDLLSFDDRSTILVLRSDIRDSSSPLVSWQLLDGRTGRILWSDRSRLSLARAEDVEFAISLIAFKTIGQEGALSYLMQRGLSQADKRSGCTILAQLERMLEARENHAAVRACLEEVAQRTPNSPQIWGLMSTFYTIRSRFYAEHTDKERAFFLKRAREAADMASRLAPEAYLTRVALMHLLLREGDVGGFDALQKELRASYPGALHLKARIASRLTRLGRAAESLAIYEEIQKYGVAVGSLPVELAFAFFVDGQYEHAGKAIATVRSSQLYVRILMAALHARLGQREKAIEQWAQLLEDTPDAAHIMYPWFAELQWSPSVIDSLADALAVADIKVDRPGNLSADVH